MTCRRDRILDAAERLLRHYGFGKTTISDIAREAGVGVGSVYLDFAGKDAIVGELSARRYDRLLEAMQAIADDDALPFARRLRALFDRRLAGFSELAASGAHGGELMHCGCAGVREASSCFADREHRLLAGFLRAGHEAGALTVPEPERSAKALLRAYLWSAPPWVFKLERTDLEAAMPAVHDLVLAGLLRR